MMNIKPLEILERNRALFEKKAFAHFATLMKDGSPQVSPVWIDFDGRTIIVNTAKGRQKDLNVRHDPRVALSIQDPDDPYLRLQVRGKVVRITTEGADAHIDKLAKKYTDSDHYQNRAAGEVRELILIQPLHVTK
jgi:PPOX class probable F420-dependent enzyme